MLRENTVNGEGNMYSTEFRMFDARLGRWMSLDPLMDQFPWMSPFVGMDNNPISLIDPLGLSTGDDKAKELGLPGDPKDGKVYKANNGNKYLYKDGHFRRQLDKITIKQKWWQKIKKIVKKVNVKIQKALRIINDIKDKTVKKEGSEPKTESTTGAYSAFKGVGIGSQFYWGGAKRKPSWELNYQMRQYDDFGRKVTYGSFGILAFVPAVSYGIVTAPTWAPYAWNLAKGYHYTFGVNGGYENMAYNYGYQSMSTGNLGIGNKDLIGLGLSAFTTRGTPVLQQAFYGASGAFFQYSLNKGPQIMPGSGGYVFGSMANGALTPVLSNSRFGNNFSSNFVFGASQMIINIYENKEN